MHPIMAPSFSLARRTRHGFSLTEIAIVLGVIGLIFGSVWAVAASVGHSHRQTQVMRQMSTVVNNIRDQYAAVIQWPAAGTDMTATFAGQNLFPSEMVQGGTYTHALGGAFSVQTANNQVTGIPSTVRLQFAGLSAPDCAAIIAQLPLTESKFGILRVAVNGTAIVRVVSYAGVGGAPVWDVTPPLSSTQIAAACATEPDTLAVEFKLHP